MHTAFSTGQIDLRIPPKCFEWIGGSIVLGVERTGKHVGILRRNASSVGVAGDLSSGEEVCLQDWSMQDWSMQDWSMQDWSMQGRRAASVGPKIPQPCYVRKGVLG